LAPDCITILHNKPRFILSLTLYLVQSIGRYVKVDVIYFSGNYQ
jgi:hypothetical protein